MVGGVKCKSTCSGAAEATSLLYALCSAFLDPGAQPLGMTCPTVANATAVSADVWPVITAYLAAQVLHTPGVAAAVFAWAGGKPAMELQLGFTGGAANATYLLNLS